MAYVVEYNGKEFTLEAANCGFFLNDEDRPIQGVEAQLILDEMAQSDMVYFQKEYYDQACEGCRRNRKEGAKFFEFLEFHFYLFAKEGAYVMSSLSVAYEYKTLPDLLKEGIVDSSYIVSVNVCEQCGTYTIDLEYGLW